ncbi:MAG: type II toxin-antitoxin system RelE/ParE family toxin [Candidatus Omnitrophica bacterium]|nr:type II toxin-antitoxin system RelE/ParE family toxin [Candidatus Omnitrophota bacterium]
MEVVTYQLLYHHDIADDLAHIPANIRKRLQKAIESRLILDPISYGLPLRKSLQGHRKLRVGDYRIIYRIETDQIIILKIGHRRDVYLSVLHRLTKPI